MDIFQLFGRIAIDSSGADNAIEETVGKVEGSEGRFSSACKKIGAVVAGAFAIDKIKDFGVACIEAGAAFDSQMSTVSAISGATQEEFEALRAKAQEMGAATAFSATESGEAMEYMAMAGWKTEDMLNGIEGIMNLAAASGEELGTTSDIVTDALTAFGLTAQDSGHFADVLAAASTNANTNVSMMGETFKYVAPVAGALNISVEDTAEAIGLLANSGIKSSQAGTTLRSILTRLSTDAGASSKSLGALGVLTEELGVEFYDSEGKVRNFGTILEEARGQWKTLSEEDAATFAKKIAGEEGISGWLALMNAAPADIEKLNKAIKDCDGSAKEMAEIKLDNLQGDVTLFKSALEGAQIAISDKLTPHLRNFVQGATNLLPKALDAFMKVGKYLVNTFSPAFTSLKNLFKTVASAAEPIIKRFIGISDASEESTESTNSLKGILELLADVIKTTADVVSDFIEWLTSGSSSAEAFKGVIETLAIGFGVYKGVMLAINIAEEAQTVVTRSLAAAHALLNAMTPFGWAAIAVTSIAALGVALVKLSGHDDIVVESFAALSEEEQALRDETNKLTESYKEWKSAKDETLQGISEEYGNYEILAGELDNIVDKNGKITSGYEDRAKIITGELSEALGIEIEIVDGVIQKYDELQQSIEDTIEKEKAKAIQSSMADKYTEALEKMRDIKPIYSENLAEYNETLAEYENVTEKLNNITGMTTEEFNAQKVMLLGTKNAWMDQSQAVEYLSDAQSGIAHRFMGVRNAYIDSETAFVDCATTIKNYEGVTSAIETDEADKIKAANDNLLNSFQTAETGTERSLQNQVANLEKEFNNMKKAYETGNANISKADLDGKEHLYKQAKSELEQYREMHGTKARESGDSFSEGLKSKSADCNASGVAIAQSGVDGANSVDYATPGSVAGETYASSMVRSAQSIINSFINSASYTSGKSHVADLVGSVKSGNIPHAATGGIIDKATIIEAGEDGTEAIVPLEKNTGWIEVMANKLAGAMGSQGGGITVVVENVNMKSDDDIEENAYKFEAMRRRAAIALGDT